MRTGQRVLFSVATSNWPARREGGGVQGIPYAWRVLDLINRTSTGMPMRSKDHAAATITAAIHPHGLRAFRPK